MPFTRTFQTYLEHQQTCNACCNSLAKGTPNNNLECQIAEILYYLSVNAHDAPRAAKFIANRYPPDAVQAALSLQPITHAQKCIY